MARSRVRSLVGIHPFEGLVPPEPFHRNNAVSVLLMGALPAVGGSAISILLQSFLVWGVLSLLAGRFPWSLTRGDRLLASSFSAFAAIMLATALIADNPSAGFLKWLDFLPYLTLWVVIPRLRASSHLPYLTLYSLGAAVGSMAALVVALIETGYELRPEGGAGNAAVFGIMALATACLAALNISSPRPCLRWFAAAGACCGIAAACLSLTRGVWLAALPALVAVLAYAPKAWFRQIAHPASIAALGLVTGLAIWQGDRLSRRWEQASASTQEMLTSEIVSDESLGLRLEMWTKGGQAFMEAPFVGYGVQNRKEVLDVSSAGDNRFTHAHNGFLSVALDAGLLGLLGAVLVLAMPVVTAFRASRHAPWDPNNCHRLFMAVLLSLIYAVCGLSQIMFKHDIMDSFYVFTSMVIAASIPPTYPGKARRRIAPSERQSPAKPRKRR